MNFKNTSIENLAGQNVPNGYLKASKGQFLIKNARFLNESPCKISTNGLEGTDLVLQGILVGLLDD